MGIIKVINDIQYKNDLQICALFKLEYKGIKNKSLEERIQNKNYILGLFKRKQMNILNYL